MVINSSFRLLVIIFFLFNIYIIQITFTSSVTGLSTNWANSWSSMSWFTVWLRLWCAGSRFEINVGAINAIMPHLPTNRANLRATSFSFPSRRNSCSPRSTCLFSPNRRVNNNRSNGIGNIPFVWMANRVETTRVCRNKRLFFVIRIDIPLISSICSPKYK